MKIEWHCKNCDTKGVEDITLEIIFTKRNKGETLIDILLNHVENIHEKQEKFKSKLPNQKICEEPCCGIKNI